jgi:hypothetical protein
MSQNVRRGAILIAVSLGINILLIVGGVGIYATSFAGLALWGALIYGMFLIGREVYRSLR